MSRSNNENNAVKPSASPSADSKTELGDLELATRAADGDRAARRRVSDMVDPIIGYQTRQLCRRFCHGNYRYYQCTLGINWELGRAELPLCEWGNASYGWMLDELTRDSRLRNYQGRNGARLKDYLYRIANSLPFYERWKNWRFSRRVNVPACVSDLHELADRVFYALQAGDEPPRIAQQLGRPEAEMRQLCRDILRALAVNHRLHLLEAPKTVSLSLGAGEDQDREQETPIPVAPEDHGQLQTSALLWQAWDQLSAVEQFVLEAMLIDERDAQDVLEALRALELDLDGTPAAVVNRQQLYYFRRKTLAKLGELVADQGLDSSNH